MAILFTYILASSIMISASIFTSECLPIVMATDVSSEVALKSPSLRMQEIKDTNLDWVDLKTRTPTTQGDRSTDILAVDYFSDGKTLNATFWLYFPFKANHSSSSNEEVNYGMYIDADFDTTTGYGGIDYKVEISWNSQSKQWIKKTEKWSPHGDILVIENQTISPNSISEEGERVVSLSADLDAMLYPNKYMVMFYGEVRREDTFISDFTRWISVPKLELKVSTLSPTIELRPGETETVGVQINSSQGYEPQVALSAFSPSDNIILNFINKGRVLLPSSGTITIPLHISALNNASVGPDTVFIFANSTVKPVQFIQGITEERPTFFPISAPSDDIFTQSSLSLEVNPPLTIMETIFGSSENSVMLNIPQEYLIGFYGIVLSIMVPAIVRWFTRRRQSKHLGEYMVSINSIYDRSHQDKGEGIKALEEARRDISTIYAKGKISESDYKILNEKISEYEKKINEPRITE
jgi:hypothetical protein